MSGSLRILDQSTPASKHDHVDIVFCSGKLLRYRDPRKFGALFWVSDDPLLHPRLSNLGIEPLDPAFDGQYLFEHSRKKTVTVKSFIMD